MFRIYNDWLKDFCSHYPDRHIGLACLPYGDIDWAVQEIHRCAKLGLKFGSLNFVRDFASAGRPGFYLRVVTPGMVEAGDAVTRLATDPARPTVAEAFEARRT